ncbi:LON peptidase substrate-binding domain-containing protein [Paraglaciecola aquimarina]|uniref:LON peptidase substrate-binding domain-containing protein n=1 Tax=Paraglaciecola algarum TaxID=3050085 RepID=A0ABS9DDV0_9ALTE|nr:LON peptidase substrate-binding domain-containing protein [Paraglaciecola sp. G1-23]MCF2949796.1 LON peptidase substrate-binding domain-containing protein [Paraglaciecola sp. G1-23]
MNKILTKNVLQVNSDKQEMRVQHVNLPIFPLPVFLLPEGVIRLRIFEPKYLKMVKIASQQNGFVICSDIKGSSKTNPNWGSWVHIINFDQGQDGVLEIDVKCQSLVEVRNMEKDSDSLQFGEITPIYHWSQDDVTNSTSTLSKPLKKLFENNTLLNDLYSEKPTHNTHWVTARWLELLPVDLAIKTAFVEQQGFAQATSFIEDIIFK